MRDDLDALLFDNDGVLVDTEPLFLQATREIFAELDVSLDEEQYREVSLRAGQSLFELVRERLGHDGAALDSLRTRRNERYWDLLVDGVQLMHEAVTHTLERLHGKRPMAIVSSSYRPHFDLIHSHTGLMRFFEFALTDGDYGKHKPHPEPYLAAADRLGVEASRCLVIEDTERGLMAARRAGMRCAVIPHDLSQGGDFADAEWVLEDIGELCALLEVT